MKCRIVDDLIETWLRRLGFDELWSVLINVNVASTWHKADKKIMLLVVDSNELNREANICVYIGLEPEDEFTVNFDFEYIIVYSLLRIVCENSYCCCDLHNKTASILGRQLTGWILEEE